VKKPEGEPGGEPEALQRLPPGRHGLPREFVVRNQRNRLTAGMIATVAENGYHETTIAQISAAAGVGRRTFYSYFSSKEECFLDTLGVIGGHLEEAMREAAEGEREWPRKVRSRLGALLGSLSANPDLVRFSLIAPVAAGGELSKRHRVFLERLVDVVTEGRPAKCGTQPSRSIEQALTGALAALLVGQVDAGRGERLPELAPELVELLLSPYLGRKRAIAVADG